jgi:hypothetical protein
MDMEQGESNVKSGVRGAAGPGLLAVKQCKPGCRGRSSGLALGLRSPDEAILGM